MTRGTLPVCHSVAGGSLHRLHIRSFRYIFTVRQTKRRKQSNNREYDNPRTSPRQ